MASLMQIINKSAGQVISSIGAAGGVLCKNMAALDRVSDVSYLKADTFVKNSELRDAGSIEDTILDEEERSHEREVRRMRFELARNKFLEDHPELKKQPAQPVKAKPATTRKSKATKA
jgi:hypothetical protein